MQLQMEDCSRENQQYFLFSHARIPPIPEIDRPCEGAQQRRQKPSNTRI